MFFLGRAFLFVALLIAITAASGGRMLALCLLVGIIAAIAIDRAQRRLESEVSLYKQELARDRARLETLDAVVRRLDPVAHLEYLRASGQIEDSSSPPQRSAPKEFWRQ
jgi:hypothetical protein